MGFVAKITSPAGTVGKPNMFIGTSAYASMRMLGESVVSFSDDVEACLYIAMEFMVGSLAWNDMSSEGMKRREFHNQVKETKRKYWEEEAENSCATIQKIFIDLSNCPVGKMPNYEYFENLLMDELISFGKDFDFDYDWKSKKIKRLAKRRLKVKPESSDIVMVSDDYQ